jgi:hypothetical protein
MLQGLDVGLWRHDFLSSILNREASGERFRIKYMPTQQLA